MKGPENLVIGESAVINGHRVTRLGLFGDGAYQVDDRPHDLESAGLAIAGPVAPAWDEMALPPVAQLALELSSTPAAEAAPAPPRRRSRSGVRAAARVEVPELLAEVKSAVVARSLKCTHRVFAGGEAVTVTFLGPATDARAALERAKTQIGGAGMHAEWGADNASLVVAWTAAVLSGAAPAKKPPARLHA